MFKAFSVLFFISCIFSLQAQDYKIVWQANAGGTSYDVPYDLAVDNEGNYILAGYTVSTDLDAITHHTAYYEDFFVVKFDKYGKKLWAQCYGGSSSDIAYSVSVMDTVLNIVGYTWSQDGDVQRNTFSQDVWWLQLDGHGNIMRQRCYGGIYNDVGLASKIVDNGNILIAGYSLPAKGSFNGSILKIMPDGDSLWETFIGGTGTEKFKAIDMTGNGYILAGSSESTDTGFVAGYGSADFLVTRVGFDGTEQWSRRYGGSNWDEATAVVTVNDTFFVVAGNTYSSDYMVRRNIGNYDIWLIGLNADGDTLWTKVIGGTREDLANKLILTADGNLLLAGSTVSDDGDITGHIPGNRDFWLVKLDLQGNILWNACLGSSPEDAATGILELSDNSLVASGYVQSADHDVQSNNGLSDFWLANLTEATTSSLLDDGSGDGLLIYPNPVYGELNYKALQQGELSFSVYTLTGKKIYDRTASAQEGSIELDGLLPGVYLLGVQQGKHVWYKKIVKAGQ